MSLVEQSMSSAHSFTNSDVFPGRCSPSHLALPTGLSLIPSLQVPYLLPEPADFRSIFILFEPQVCVAIGVLSSRFTPTTLVSAQAYSETRHRVLLAPTSQHACTCGINRLQTQTSCHHREPCRSPGLSRTGHRWCSDDGMVCCMT